MPHISFSELKIWSECPFKHKLMYIDKIKGFIGNEYTAFGGAIHSLCENALLGKLPEEDYEEYFQHAFRAELNKVPVSKPELVMEMLSQANRISPEVIPAVESYFGNFEVVSVEERLFEKMLIITLKASLISLLKQKTVNIILLIGSHVHGAGMPREEQIELQHIN